jgi:hypothetical protein
MVSPYKGRGSLPAPDSCGRKRGPSQSGRRLQGSGALARQGARHPDDGPEEGALVVPAEATHV